MRVLDFPSFVFFSSVNTFYFHYLLLGDAYFVLCLLLLTPSRTYHPKVPKNTPKITKLLDIPHNREGYFMSRPLSSLMCL